MQKFRNSFLILVLAAVCLPQTATQLVTPEIRRVGDKLACKCGVCNNTVATCQMLECHYSLPARQKIDAMQKLGQSDEVIVASFVKKTASPLWRRRRPKVLISSDTSCRSSRLSSDLPDSFYT